MYTCVYIYIYIYREREREHELVKTARAGASGLCRGACVHLGGTTCLTLLV